MNLVFSRYSRRLHGDFGKMCLTFPDMVGETVPCQCTQISLKQLDRAITEAIETLMSPHSRHSRPIGLRLWIPLKSSRLPLTERFQGGFHSGLKWMNSYIGRNRQRPQNTQKCCCSDLCEKCRHPLITSCIWTLVFSWYFRIGTRTLFFFFLHIILFFKSQNNPYNCSQC